MDEAKIIEISIAPPKYLIIHLYENIGQLDSLWHMMSSYYVSIPIDKYDTCCRWKLDFFSIGSIANQTNTPARILSNYIFF